MYAMFLVRNAHIHFPPLFRRETERRIERLERMMEMERVERREVERRMERCQVQQSSVHVIQGGHSPSEGVRLGTQQQGESPRTLSSSFCWVCFMPREIRAWHIHNVNLLNVCISLCT
jgi:hypothetical protein